VRGRPHEGRVFDLNIAPYRAADPDEPAVGADCLRWTIGPNKVPAPALHTLVGLTPRERARREMALPRTLRMQVALTPHDRRPMGIAGHYRVVVHSPGYFDSTEGTGEASRSASPREPQHRPHRAGKYRVARSS
jgi:hypothetical protein